MGPKCRKPLRSDNCLKIVRQIMQLSSVFSDIEFQHKKVLSPSTKSRQPCANVLRKTLVQRQMNSSQKVEAVMLKCCSVENTLTTQKMNCVSCDTKHHLQFES